MSNNLYGSITHALRTTQTQLQGQLDEARELMKSANDDDPQKVKQVEIEMKNIDTTLTYLKGIEDLLVKMSNLPQ
jgi:hypothetical protein